MITKKRDARAFWKHQILHLQQIAADESIDVNIYAQGVHARIRPHISRILEALKTSREPRTVVALLLQLNERGIIENSFLLRSIAGIADRYEERVRDIESWKVSTLNSRRQASQLLKHLFTRYEVPGFMERVFWEGDAIQQSWYIHLGRGGNLRTAGLPIQVTKKAAYYFTQAPSHYTVNDALRFGQIQAIGGDRWLVEAIRSTRLVHCFADDGFWTTLFRFLHANQSGLNERDIKRLVEYVNDIRFTPRRVLMRDGTERQVPPPQPNFSFKGRSLKRLIADVAAWEQASDDKIVDLEWLPSQKIAPFQFKYTERGPRWSIRQRLSWAELKRDGRALKHCVGEPEYALSCYTGESAIWALCYYDAGGGTENLLTIEVKEENKIVEIRGCRNCPPDPDSLELTMIRRWASLNGLKFAC